MRMDMHVCMSERVRHAAGAHTHSRTSTHVRAHPLQMKPFNYSSTKVVGVKAYEKRQAQELARVAAFTRDGWGTEGLGVSAATEELPGGRFQLRVGGEAEGGVREDARQARGADLRDGPDGPLCLGMRPALRRHALRRLVRHLPRCPLKQWWEKEPQEHLLEKHGIGPERQMCIKGGTNDEVAGHYVNKLVGDSPELMPLDSNLFSYYENAMKLNIAHTDILPHDHEEKFLIGTPADVQKTMLRTWELVPTSAQIVQDIMRFPIALDAIIAAKGAKVDWLDNRKGRRASRKRPAPHVPPSCPAAEEAQRAKFDRLDPMPR